MRLLQVPVLFLQQTSKGGGPSAMLGNLACSTTDHVKVLKRGNLHFCISVSSVVGHKFSHTAFRIGGTYNNHHRI